MIVFDAVTKVFGDGSVGVEDVSFEVLSGECAFIVGPSGSGKTTLLRLLTKEHSPTSGTISIDDTPLSAVSRWNLHTHRRRIGVVYQDYKLIEEKNVWENIALPLEISRMKTAEIEERVTELLELVGLSDHALYFPRQLSGGEAQRVAIARALAINPDIVCADEPTGNLDPKTSLAIAHLLFQIQEAGTTLLFATHDTGVLAAFPDVRTIRIEDGSVESDTASKEAPAKKPAKKAKKKPAAEEAADKKEEKQPSKKSEKPTKKTKKKVKIKKV